MADRRIVSRGSQMNVRTSRVGLMTIHASAPVVDGLVTASSMEFTVRIDRVATGNPLLDPELHSLIHQITSGLLTFSGAKDDVGFTGQATAGSMAVPLTLEATGDDAGPLTVRGSSQFSDVHVPLPGMGHIRHLEVDIDGQIHLA